jgi:SAM-dependent methyltransferase
MKGIAHGELLPSPWVTRWASLVRPCGRVLDIACGHGRHLKWFAERHHPVTGVDRSSDAIAAVAPLGQAVLADLESGPWPLMIEDRVQTFDAVIVTNYLWRTLFAVIEQSVAPGGVLIYETFASGNETVGKPSNPDFLLQPGELLGAFPELRVVAYENGFLDHPSRFVQRLAALRMDESIESASAPKRSPL